MADGAGGVASWAPQAWLGGAGAEAAAVERLFFAMAATGGVIWLAVASMAAYAVFSTPGPRSLGLGRALILWGGVALPVVALLALLIVGLTMMRGLAAPADAPVWRVVGEQFWWRVESPGPDGPVPTPNELRLPAGAPARLTLAATDVIHSFWAPALGGKRDMIPGRVNELVLRPTRTGAFRGACAEFCGVGHALMSFPIDVMAPEAFADWVAAQALPARPPRTPREVEGRDLFLATGCGACHAIRGEPAAAGALGPDLTHVASRRTIGAGVLPMTRDAMIRWIAQTDSVKPGVLMPAFDMLPDAEVALIADYLMSLR